MNRFTNLGSTSSSSDSCQELLNKIQNAKNQLWDEFRPGIAPQDRMLQLALNEADGLARQTDFPLLVFPALAREKAEKVTAWKARQDRIRGNVLHSFAA